ncbi:MAG: hypothetical protein HYX66_08880 [Ignavibacteria bacterium]|nr:hypothetical protein [Ignavibacteria bacterium]
MKTATPIALAVVVTAIVTALLLRQCSPAEGPQVAAPPVVIRSATPTVVTDIPPAADSMRIVSLYRAVDSLNREVRRLGSQRIFRVDTIVRTIHGIDSIVIECNETMRTIDLRYAQDVTEKTPTASQGGKVVGLHFVPYLFSGATRQADGWSAEFSGGIRLYLNGDMSVVADARVRTTDFNPIYRLGLQLDL